MLRKNTLDDVVRAFVDTDVQVIDLLPGEWWEHAPHSGGEPNEKSSQRIHRLWRSRERLYKIDHVLRHVARRFDEATFQQQHPAPGKVTRGEIEAYLLRLNETPEVLFCEDLIASARVIDAASEGADLEVYFEALAGKIRILEEKPAEIHLTIEVPSGILKLIIEENLSWDEAHIGFWCRFSRSRDTYHAGFWRLLQAPYFRRAAEPPPSVVGAISPDSVIAEVLETYGEPAERILCRYGLYCTGCHRATYDSLALGARHHGLDPSQVERLVRELNKLFHDQPNRPTGA
jgi:CMP-N-acetylneuraminate monooxygenase